MKLRSNKGIIAVLAILLLLLLITAGCTSIPGPEPRSTPAPAKTTVPVTPQAKVTVAMTPIPAQTEAVTKILVPVNPTPSPAGTYESRTCAQQGGGIAHPGQQCPGTWLTASDTFSCCSVPPFREPAQNASVVAEPFDIFLVIDDDPGSILP
jgi:hypothetical protein